MENEKKKNNVNNSNHKNDINHKPIFTKIKYFKDFLKIYEDLNKYIINSIKDFQSKNISKQFIIDDEEKIHIITEVIINMYIKTLSDFQKFIEKITHIFTKYINDISKFQKKYNAFDEYNKTYQQKNKKFLEIKSNYHKNGKELEKIAMAQFGKNEPPTAELDNLFIKTKDSLDKYKLEVNEINAFKNEYNNKSNNLINIYDKLEKIFLYNRIKEQFDTYLQNNLKRDSKIILDINTKKKYTPQKVENSDKNIEAIKPLETEKFIHYPTSIDFNLATEEKEYYIYDKTVKYIKNNLNEDTLFQDYDEEKENIIKEKKKKIVIFFNNKNISKENIEENKSQLINMIKDPSNQNILILMLSKYRSVNERSKEWIDLMGECLNIILETSINNNLYDMIKNCIILSQTYYYLNEDTNDKIYISNILEKNEFFKDPEFWKNFINTNILNQLVGFKESNNLKVLEVDNFIKGEEINDKIRAKLADFLFTQLLPYVNNMIDFKLEKNNIIEVVNYFNEKYKYLTKGDYETIISVISNRSK